MKKLISTLLVIIMIMIIVVAALLIAKCATGGNDTPTVEPTADLSATGTPDAGMHSDMPETASPDVQNGATPEGGSAQTLEPTQNASNFTPDPSIERCVTEGTLDDVFARLEQLKTLPEDATVILLDVGHGGMDGGSLGVDTGVKEADVNLQVSRALAEKLAEKGYYVFMTRMGDYALAETKSGDMEKRTEIMKLGIFDLSVSIHMNSFPQDRSVSGARVYCYQTGTPSENLATIVAQSICAANGSSFRQIYTDDLMVVREPIAPSILVECGFLSNKQEEGDLQNVQYQQLLGKAIADGIESFLSSMN